MPSSSDPELNRQAAREWRAANRERHRAYTKAYQTKHGYPERTPRQIRASNLRKYGLTIEQFDQMVVAQGSVCFICQRPETVEGFTLSVDHSHETGRVRGLLCLSCNIRLGCLERGLNTRFTPDQLARVALHRAMLWW